MAQVSKKTTVYLNDELMERIDELGIKLSPFIQRVYLRYREVVAENTVRLTREEKEVLIRVLEASVVDNHFIRYLDQEIEDCDDIETEAGQALLKKVRDADFTHRVAMVESMGY